MKTLEFYNWMKKINNKHIKDVPQMTAAFRKIALYENN